jgi:hydroxyacylglutathione hydrolase
MNRWITHNGYKVFQVLSGRSNSYMISNDEQNILVDTGKETAFSKLRENIKTLGLDNSDISHLILTHTHFDHCQSAYQIKSENNCQIVVSENAAVSISNGYTKLPEGTLLTTKLVARIGQFTGKKRFGYKTFIPDFLISGDDEFQMNNYDLSIIETPGHSQDSISIIIDNEIAIVGDVMFGAFRNSVFPPYADSIETMVGSWEKLLNTDCEIFLPGHGREIRRSLLRKEYDKHARKHII